MAVKPFKVPSLLAYHTLHGHGMALARGLMLFHHQKVHDVRFREDRTEVLAKVSSLLGNEPVHEVRILHPYQINLMSTYCTCGQTYCEHRAALFYWLDNMMPTAESGSPYSSGPAPTGWPNQNQGINPGMQQHTTETAPKRAATPDELEATVWLSTKVQYKYQHATESTELPLVDIREILTGKYLTRTDAQKIAASLQQVPDTGRAMLSWAESVTLQVVDASSGFAHKVSFAPVVNGGKITGLQASCTCYAHAMAGICWHKVTAHTVLLQDGWLKRWATLPSKSDAIKSLIQEAGFGLDNYSKYIQILDTPDGLKIKPIQKGLLLSGGTEPTSKALARTLSTQLAPLEEDGAEGGKTQYQISWALMHDHGFQLEPLRVRVTKKGPANTGKTLNQLQPLEYIHLIDATDKLLLKLTAEAITAYKQFSGSKREADAMSWQYQKKSWPLLVQKGEVAVMGTGAQKIEQFVPVQANARRTRLVVNHAQGIYKVQLEVELEDDWQLWYKLEKLGGTSFIDHNQLQYIDGTYLLPYLEGFESNAGWFVPENKPLEVLFNEVAAPLSVHMPVVVRGIKLKQDLRLLSHSQFCLYLTDQNGHLQFNPVFKYQYLDETYEFGLGGTGQLLWMEQDTLVTASRNHNWEADQLSQLQDLHPHLAEQDPEKLMQLPFGQVLANGWILKLSRMAEQLGWTLLGQNQFKHFKYSTAAATTSLRHSWGVDWLDIELALSFGKEKVPMKRVRQALLEGRNYVVLTDGSFGMMPEEWLRKVAPLLQIGQENKEGLRVSKLHTHLLADEDIPDLEAKALPFKQLAMPESLPEVLVPGDLQATLRPYQQHGYNWLCFHYGQGTGALLADDMGLGKTVQLLAYLLWVKEQQKTHRPSLVVLPTSLLYNWQAEAAKFTPSLNVALYYGPQRMWDQTIKEADLVLSTYGTVRNDIELLRQIDFEVVVLDEAHSIKNPSAAITAAVVQLKAVHRVAATGTPIENRTADLYSQLHFLNPGFLGTREGFHNRFSIPIDQHADAERAQLLRRLVAPFILRRTKEQVAQDLPAKTESTLICELTRAQRALYDQYKTEYQQQVQEALMAGQRETSSILILSAIQKLRMLCTSAALEKPELAKTDEHSAKLTLLMEELATVSQNHKVLVFSNFLGMLQLAADALRDAGIGYLYMDGSTTKRQPLVDAFMTDESKRVFLLSMKVGGVGLNLTAAEYVFILDPWWNPAAEQQAIDRTHRIGQQRPVFAYKLIARDTIEERILDLQMRKKALAADLISTDENTLSTLSDTELLQLFA